MAQYSCKVGDTWPSLRVTVLDGDGAAIAVTGCTIKFSMIDAESEETVIDEATGAIVNAAAGQIEYAWQAGDTDTPGIYRGFFTISSGSRVFTAPNQDYIEITIESPTP